LNAETALNGFRCPNDKVRIVKRNVVTAADTLESNLRVIGQLERECVEEPNGGGNRNNFVKTVVSFAQYLKKKLILAGVSATQPDPERCKNIKIHDMTSLHFNHFLHSGNNVVCHILRCPQEFSKKSSKFQKLP